MYPKRIDTLIFSEDSDIRAYRLYQTQPQRLWVTDPKTFVGKLNPSLLDEIVYLVIVLFPIITMNMRMYVILVEV